MIGPDENGHGAMLIYKDGDDELDLGDNPRNVPVKKWSIE